MEVQTLERNIHERCFKTNFETKVESWWQIEKISIHQWQSSSFPQILRLFSAFRDFLAVFDFFSSFSSLQELHSTSLLEGSEVICSSTIWEGELKNNDIYFPHTYVRQRDRKYLNQLNLNFKLAKTAAISDQKLGKETQLDTGIFGTSWGKELAKLPGNCLIQSCSARVHSRKGFAAHN